MGMRFKSSHPPIPLDELRALSRGQTNSTVLRLLWEIKRLRAVEGYGQQIVDLFFRGHIRPLTPTDEIIIIALKRALEGDLLTTGSNPRTLR